MKKTVESKPNIEIRHIALKVRLYPNKEQRIFINNTIGCTRKIYNLMLDERKEVYDKLKDNKKALHAYKYKTEKQYKEEFPFLKDVDSKALIGANADLQTAYKNFFSSQSGKRKGKKVGYPKYRSLKKGDNSYRTYEPVVTRIDYDKHKLHLLKLGWVKYRNPRRIEGTLKSVTIRRSNTGKYFASILFEQEILLREEKKKTPINDNQVIGLDMDFLKFFVDNKGNSPDYKRLYRISEKRLKFLQKNMSRKKKDSKNWEKAKRRVAVLSEKTANSRKDFINKTSTQLVKKYEVIVVEGINYQGMAQCRKNGKSVHDLAWGMFRSQLEYKTKWNNKILIEADKFFPSSKTCSECGFVHKGLQSDDIVYICPNCKLKIDRDKNAAINLKNYGLKELGLGRPI